MAARSSRRERIGWLPCPLRIPATSAARGARAALRCMPIATWAWSLQPLGAVSALMPALSSCCRAPSPAPAPGLAEWLRGRRVRALFVCGVATEHCVRASVLDGLQAGFQVALLTDAGGQSARLAGHGRGATKTCVCVCVCKFNHAVPPSPILPCCSSGRGRCCQPGSAEGDGVRRGGADAQRGAVAAVGRASRHCRWARAAGRRISATCSRATMPGGASQRVPSRQDSSGPSQEWAAGLQCRAAAGTCEGSRQRNASKPAGS